MAEPDPSLAAPGPKRPSFFLELEALMDKHGMADWVVAAKAVDSQVKATWVAGTGVDVISDRERAAYLFFEIHQLALSIQKKYTPT